MLRCYTLAHFLWKNMRKHIAKHLGPPAIQKIALHGSLSALPICCISFWLHDSETIDTTPLSLHEHQAQLQDRLKPGGGPSSASLQTETQKHKSWTTWMAVDSLPRSPQAKVKKRLTWVACKMLWFELVLALARQGKKDMVCMQFHIPSALRSRRIRTPWLKVGKCPAKASQCDSHFCCLVQYATHGNF